MIAIAWTIIRYHWRKNHILWLFVLVLLWMAIQPLIESLALGEASYVWQAWLQSGIEIIGISFSIYFAATTYSLHRESKILTILSSKRQSAYSYIGWIIGWIMSIMIIYSIIVAIIMALSTNGWWAISLMIMWILIFSIMVSITTLLSLIATPYIVIATALIIYSLSYTISFLLFMSEAYQTGTYTIISIIALLLPRFDILTSLVAWSQAWRRAVLGHSGYSIVIISLTILSFSLSYPWRSSPVSTHDSNKKD